MQRRKKTGNRLCHPFGRNVSHTSLVNILLALAPSVFGARAAGQVRFKSFHCWTTGKTKCGWANQCQGFYPEKIGGVHESGVGADHEL